jgi:hypothetical protein
MPKSITKLLVAFGTAICFTGFLGTTITRSQPDSSNNCLSNNKDYLTSLNKNNLTSLTDTQKISKTMKEVPKEFRDDTAKPELCERSKNLIPLTKDNSELIRKGDLVLMISWQGNSCSPGPKCLSSLKPGIEYTVEKNHQLWLTAVPELQRFILSQTNSVALVSRLEQYLGLKPNSNYTNFVEVWVNPENLVRPCVDQDVNDKECDIPSQAKKLDPELVKKTKDYPFTGLGYTYDWGNPKTDIGASEFTVKAGKTVIVHENRTTSNYLQGLTPHLQQK